MMSYKDKSIDSKPMLASKINKEHAQKTEPCSFREKVRIVRKRYVSSFTMHAIDHISNGTFVEQVFWSFKLFAALALAIYLSKKLFLSYLDHDVDTKIIIQTSSQLQFPMVLIGDRAVGTYLFSRNNCSSFDSISYKDTRLTTDGLVIDDICPVLKQKCPHALPIAHVNATGVRGGRHRGDASVQCDVMGQFVTVNADGKLHQTHSIDSMEILIEDVWESHLPLNILIRIPDGGSVDGASMPKGWYEITTLKQMGSYQFSLEKTTITRLPKPFSDPSCIEQDSDEARSLNMFKGNYSMTTCKETCVTKAELLFCNTATNMRRHYIRDQAHLAHHFRDQPKDQVKECLLKRENDIDSYLEQCAEQCHSPCFEQSFRTNGRFLGSERMQNHIELSFHYEDMKETYIREEPKYEIETLISNFGGQLGLMAGMSALSIIEVVIWFVLLCIEGLFRLISACRKTAKECVIEYGGGSL